MLRARHDGDVPRTEEALHAEALRAYERPQRRLHQTEHREHRVVPHSLLPGREDAGRSAGGSRLKADPQEDLLALRVLFCQLHGVHGRVHQLDRAAARPPVRQVVPAPRAGDAEHVAVARHGDARP